MFKRSTTLVVGAGASCELNLPSGDQLKARIIDILTGTEENGFGFVNVEVQKVIRREVAGQVNWPQMVAPWKAAAARICRGLPLALSIDNYLHAHQGDVDVERLGKLAITIAILEAESNSKLFGEHFYILDRERGPVEPSLRNDELFKTWYPCLAQLLMSQAQKSSAHQVFSNVRFIIFNYDRCLEQFLWLVLQSYFDLSGPEAASILADVEFIHPYGSLGPLPWQTEISGEAVPLGGLNVDPLIVSQRIRTFTESLHSSIGSAVKEAIASADTIIILGFGYLDQNLELLSPVAEKRARRIISTAYQASGIDQAVINDSMCRLGHDPRLVKTLIEPGTCRDLFDHFHLELSLR